VQLNPIGGAFTVAVHFLSMQPIGMDRVGYDKVRAVERILGSEKSPNAEPAGSDFDIPSLLGYGGPSLRDEAPIADGIALMDFRDTDANERNITVLLSSQGIPFNMERPKYGWTGTKIRMRVVVPGTQYRQANAILAAAAKALAVDVVAGAEGLYSR
jgi:hypothetical protein